MNYINLKVLTAIIHQFCQHHSQINFVSVNNEIDFRALAIADYPVVNIEPVEANLADNLTSQGFIITVADIMNTNFEGENNYRLIDSSQRIANDIINYLQGSFDFDASTNITLNSFEDEGTARTAGVTFRINLIYNRDTSTCILDDIVSIPVAFCVNKDARTVRFNVWLLHPFIEDYEVSFDGGNSWETMTKYVYDISDDEIPVGEIQQRLKAGKSIANDVLMNNKTIPAKE